MNQQIKPDAHLFVNYIDQLIKEPWLGQSRRWWPKFVYHFTNIDNAVKILEDGRLLSRGKLTGHGLITLVQMQLHAPVIGGCLQFKLSNIDTNNFKKVLTVPCSP